MNWLRWLTVLEWLREYELSIAQWLKCDMPGMCMCDAKVYQQIIGQVINATEIYRLQETAFKHWLVCIHNPHYYMWTIRKHQTLTIPLILHCAYSKRRGVPRKKFIANYVNKFRFHSYPICLLAAQPKYISSRWSVHAA